MQAEAAPSCARQSNRHSGTAWGWTCVGPAYLPVTLWRGAGRRTGRILVDSVKRGARAVTVPVQLRSERRAWSSSGIAAATTRRAVATTSSVRCSRTPAG